MSCELKIVGLVHIEFVSIRNIESFKVYPRLDGSYGGQVLLKAGSSWRVLTQAFIESDKRIWEESITENAAQNDLFDNKVNDIVPQADFNAFQIDEMQRDQFLVRFETQNGEKYLVGTLKEPLDFRATTNSNRATYAVQFQNKQSHKALKYQYV